MIRDYQLKTKGTLPMPRQLHYVSGVRLILDPYDRWLWHFMILRKRYELRARGRMFILRADDGTLLGTFDEPSDAVARARENAHQANTERLPALPPQWRAMPAR